MSAVRLEDAAFIVHGYVKAKCQCGLEFFKAPWFVPGGNWCEACRDGVIEHFKEESREIGIDEEADA
jgi:hypothetical protein